MLKKQRNPNSYGVGDHTQVFDLGHLKRPRAEAEVGIVDLSESRMGATELGFAPWPEVVIPLQ